MGRCLLLVFFATLLPIHGMDAEEKANMKNLVKEMFYHGYDSYIKYAFPRKLPAQSFSLLEKNGNFCRVGPLPLCLQMTS